MWTHFFQKSTKGSTGPEWVQPYILGSGGWQFKAVWHLFLFQHHFIWGSGVASERRGLFLLVLYFGNEWKAHSSKYHLYANDCRIYISSQDLGSRIIYSPADLTSPLGQLISFSNSMHPTQNSCLLHIDCTPPFNISINGIITDPGVESKKLSHSWFPGPASTPPNSVDPILRIYFCLCFVPSPP